MILEGIYTHPYNPSWINTMLPAEHGVSSAHHPATPRFRRRASA